MGVLGSMSTNLYQSQAYHADITPYATGSSGWIQTGHPVWVQRRSRHYSPSCQSVDRFEHEGFQSLRG